MKVYILAGKVGRTASRMPCYWGILGVGAGSGVSANKGDASGGAGMQDLGGRTCLPGGKEFSAIPSAGEAAGRLG